MKHKKKGRGERKSGEHLSVSKTGRQRPVITVDYEKYAHFLEDSDLTDEQKQEFLQTLWNIIVEFVSLGFGVHPLQQAKLSCGKLNENPQNAALTERNELYLDQQIITDNFLKVADPIEESEPEGVA